MTLTSEAGQPVLFQSPWGTEGDGGRDGVVVVNVKTGKPVLTTPLSKGIYSWNTTAGATYAVSSSSALEEAG